MALKIDEHEEAQIIKQRIDALVGIINEEFYSEVTNRIWRDTGSADNPVALERGARIHEAAEDLLDLVRKNIVGA